MSRLIGVTLVAVLASGCGGFFARFAARRIANDQMSITSFRGRTTEKHVLTASPTGELVKDVWYEKPSKVRVEVVAPPELKGQLFVADAGKVSMWWPGWRFGVRMRGVPVVEESEQWDFIRTQARKAYGEYRYSRLDDAQIAGRDVTRWSAAPRHEGRPYQYPYDSWVDHQKSIPLRLELYEAPGKPWYEVHYDSIEFDVPLEASTFAFEFPADAMVFDVDFAAPGVALEEAERTLGWKPLTIRGERIEKVLVAEGGATVVMNEGARWLTLTERKATVEVVPQTGKVVKVGEATGYLDFLGSYSALSLTRDGVVLTLVTNLPYVELLRLAAELE